MGSKGLKICLTTILLLLIIVTIVIVILFFTVFKPKEPIIIVHPVGLENFNLSLLTNVSANVSLAMMITMVNPNYETFEYANATGYVKFHDTVVGQVPIVAQLVPARSHLNLNTWANFMVAELINDPNFFSDVVSGTLNFTSTASLPGKARLLKIIKMKAIVYSSCDISLNITSRKADSKCICKMNL